MVNLIAGNLTDLKTKYIIPVDLNAIMCWNADLMSKFYKRVGDSVKAAEYAEKKAQIVEAVKKVRFIYFLAHSFVYSLFFRSFG